MTNINRLNPILDHAGMKHTSTRIHWIISIPLTQLTLVLVDRAKHHMCQNQFLNLNRESPPAFSNSPKRKKTVLVVYSPTLKPSFTSININIVTRIHFLNDWIILIPLPPLTRNA